MYLSRKGKVLNQTCSREELAVKDAQIRPGQISSFQASILNFSKPVILIPTI